MGPLSTTAWQRSAPSHGLPNRSTFARPSTHVISKRDTAFLPLPDGECESPNPRQSDPISVVDPGVLCALTFGVEPKGLFASFDPYLNMSL
tara:strand:- start:341 stop:613 length:273 start_codon:yes stop_codon:yes gene_type:complete